MSDLSLAQPVTIQNKRFTSFPDDDTSVSSTYDKVGADNLKKIVVTSSTVSSGADPMAGMVPGTSLTITNTTIQEWYQRASASDPWPANPFFTTRSKTVTTYQFGAIDTQANTQQVTVTVDVYDGDLNLLRSGSPNTITVDLTAAQNDANSMLNLEVQPRTQYLHDRVTGIVG